MRGHKGDIWENGVRSPLFVRWGSRFPPRLVEAPADVTDLFPTVLELTGVAVPEGGPLDGRSLVPLLEGGTREEKTIFHWAHRGWISGDRPWTPEGLPGEYLPWTEEMLRTEAQALAIRRGRYKLLVNPLATDHESERQERNVVLVDLEKDPEERKNRAREEKELTASLLADVDAWFDEIVALPSSFVPATFLVGLDVDRDTGIATNAPMELHDGVTNTLRYLTGWDTEREWADYAVDVRTPAAYDVTLAFQGAPPRDATFTVSTTFGAGRLEIDAEGQQKPARLALPPGPTVLRLELTRAGQPETLADARMIRLLLRLP
jgi:hypothetical protein